VDDIVALAQVLELGNEGPPGRTADQDFLFGEYIAFRKYGDPFRGIAPSSLQIAEKKQDLRGAGRGKRTDLLPGSDFILGKEGGHLLPDHRVGKKDRAALSLPLQTLQILDEKRDLVVEPRHRPEWKLI
jgi:hypothetical protein